MLVIAVLHQPRYSIFCMFDAVLLLASGGRQVYFGPARGVVGYFDSLGFNVPVHENPADFCLDVIAG